jgi:hypothetical protein
MPYFVFLWRHPLRKQGSNLTFCNKKTILCNPAYAGMTHVGIIGYPQVQWLHVSSIKGAKKNVKR